MNQVLSEGPRAPGRGAESTAVRSPPGPEGRQSIPFTLPWGSTFLLPLPPRLMVGAASLPTASQQVWEPVVSSLPPLVLQGWGALSPHGRGPWECRVLSLVPRCPWLVAVDGCRNGEWGPVQGGSFPPEIAQMPYVKGELTAESARNDGRRAGGGLLRPECGSDL